MGYPRHRAAPARSDPEGIDQAGTALEDIGPAGIDQADIGRVDTAPEEFDRVDTER